MPEFRIQSVRLYTQPQPPMDQMINAPWLSYLVSGFRRLVVTEAGIDLRYPPPLLRLAVPGEHTYFETTAGRRNYVAVLDGVSWRYAGTGGHIEWEVDAGAWIRIPALVFPPPGEVDAVDAAFARLVALSQAPTPGNLLAASCETAALLLHFLKRQPREPDSPASRLRRQIDEDTTFARPLPVLCRHCGYSTSHLRAAFKAEMGLTPHDYRARRRMTVAMDLISGSSRSVKEIAGLTGFGSVPHFSVAFHAHFGMPPSDAIRMFRLHERAAAVPPDAGRTAPRDEGPARKR